MRQITRCIAIGMSCWCTQQIAAQAPDSDSSLLRPLPVSYTTDISRQAGILDQRLDKTTSKYLDRIARQDEKLYRKLWKKDSTKAKEVLAASKERYNQLQQRLQQAGSKQYIPTLDTLATSLKFLQQNPQLLSGTKGAQEKIKNALGRVGGLEDRFKQADQVKEFLKQRREYLRQQLSQLGFSKQLKQINKQVYYYSEQVNEYKELLKDHKKAEKKAIELLSGTKLFKDFMRKNSQLASLFRMPGDPNDPASQASMAGLQTRAQVNGLIQQQLAAGGPGAQQQFRQNLQQAQSQLSELKNKMSKLGRSSSTDEMPEGFKPNDQKTKSFLQRFELGTNIQSQKPNGYFPVTSDIGLSVGYKLNDKSIIGIGASYKLGWGKDIRHINITHQGMGLRSFADWKIKGSFWLSGGYEMNYRSAFNNIPELRDRSAWQQSGLLGLSKIVSLKAKFFKKTKLQLLWDFMSYQQVPRTQPVVFRIGYSIK